MGKRSKDPGESVSSAQFAAIRPARFRDAQTRLADALPANAQLQSNMRRGGYDPAAETARLQSATKKTSTRETYRGMGWDKEPAEERGPHPRQGTLVDHPNTVDAPTRWEDLPKDSQDKTLSRLKEFDVTPESAQKSLGSRMDAASVDENGGHRSFYSTEGASATGAKLPRQVLKDSAAANGVPFHHQAVANAITSPQNRFVSRTAGGDVEYPNDQAASFAINWEKQGKTGEEYVHHPDYYVPNSDKVPHPKTGKLVKAPGETRKYPGDARGYPANVAKAVTVLSDVRGGQQLREAWKAGPKTGPFLNAWTAPDHPEGHFSVLDTHAAEALAPHLSTADQTKLLAVPNVHAFNDHAMRKSMDDRGLSSVSRTQSAMWRSTKVDEGHAADVAELTPEAPSTVSKQFKGQGKLF